MEQYPISPDEQLALTLLRNTPTEIQKLARANGTINVTDLHQYFIRLARRLEFVRCRGTKDYIDVEKETSNAI
jgi:hypothetical protein